MKWTLKSRKLWYKLTGKPVWLHSKCVKKESQKIIATSFNKDNDYFHKPFWVTGYHCPKCDVDIEAEDYYCNRPAGEWTMQKLDPKNYSMFSRFNVDDR
jgi:hypothetical protein